MSRDLNASLNYEKNLLESGGMVSLFAVQVNASPVLTDHWAQWNKDIDYFKVGTATPQTYTAIPISRGEIEEDDGTKIPTLLINVGAVDEVITAYIEANDALRRNKVEHITVPYDQLGNASACIVDTFYVDGANLDGDSETATFTLTTKGAVADVTVPLRAMRRDQCAWKYVGNQGYNATQLAATECKCAIADSGCKHTKADCASKDNLLNFGAFPGISTRHVSF